MSYLDEVFGLKGKVAIVTGGGRGIGQTISVAFAKAGAKVAIFSRSSSKETVDMIEKIGGEALWISVDVTKEESVNVGIRQVISHFGNIDILFNNAGICMHQTTFEATVEEFRQVVDTNLTGEFIVARAVAKHMVAHQVKGSIINMASMSGSIVNIPQMQCSYNASKAGVMHMSKSLAIEFAKYGIRVNSLSPGYVGTPMSTDTPQELKDAWMPLIPMGRMAKPEELVPPVLYLACEAAGYTTGSDIIVDGGYTAL